ncbi:MAG: FtsX-like permease family protein [Culicoidibacterales bacterium]
MRIYLKLSLKNIRNNSKLYLPVVIIIAIFFAIIYNLKILAADEYIKNEISQILHVFLIFGVIIGSIITAILTTYAQSFTLNKRMRELGLYQILGMEYRHLLRLLAYETGLVYAVGIASGHILGISTTKAIFLLERKLLSLETVLAFSIAHQSLIELSLFFCFIFLGQLLYMALKIKKLKPIEILQQSQKRDTHLRFSKILLITSLLALSGGYFMALTMKKTQLPTFDVLIAVLLVVLGTYGLFTSMGVFILLFLQKRKGYYYRMQPFLLINGLLYRIKRNAVSLASITILATMVMITLIMTTTIYLYGPILLKQEQVYDEYAGYADANSRDQILDKIETMAASVDVKVENLTTFRKISWEIPSKNEEFALITVADYNKESNNQLVLEEKELAIFARTTKFPDTKITIAGEEFTIKQTLKEMPFTRKINNEIAQTYWLVLPTNSFEKLENWVKLKDKNVAKRYEYILAFDTSGLEENRLKLATIMDVNSRQVNLQTRMSLVAYQKDFKKMNGSFMFIGLFMSLMFMSMAVVLVYYKQIAEAYEDKIMQQQLKQVGLSAKELKKNINFQVLIIFFLPLIVAISHTLFAAKIMIILLAQVSISNKNYIYGCGLVIIVLFSIGYFIVFKITARQYYLIVRKEERR